MINLWFATGLDFLADGGADFEHAITVTGKPRTHLHTNCVLIKRYKPGQLSEPVESFISGSASLNRRLSRR